MDRTGSSGVESLQPNEQTYVARLTARVPAAIATIGLQGPMAETWIQQHVRFANRSIHELPIGRILYGFWQSRDCSVQQAAEQVVVCRTSESVCELHCHGGQAVCQMILGDLERAGAHVCASVDFPLHYSDATVLEASEDLTMATCDRAAAILVDQLNGALQEAFVYCQQLAVAHRKADAADHARSVLKWTNVGLHLIRPWRVVLAGPPNVGKSSLMNAILGQQRAIVHEQAGTTRDWIEGITAIDGWPIALTDTAGVRRTEDTIEREGVRRSLSQIEGADLVLLVVDASEGWTSAHERIQTMLHNRPHCVVLNKADLSPSNVTKANDAIRVSATTGDGMRDLLSRIRLQLLPEEPKDFQAVPFRERHVRLLESYL